MDHPSSFAPIKIKTWVKKILILVMQGNVEYQ